MEEFDLRSMWQGADKQADSWYQERQEELWRQAKRRNEHVLRRIQRMVWMETIFSVVMTIALLGWMLDIVGWLWWTLLVMLTVTIVISYRYYSQFRGQVDEIPSLNIKRSTEEFLHLLRSYKQRMIRLSVILTPVALIMGFAGGFSEGAENDFSKLTTWEFWAISLPTLVLAGVFFYYFTHWYYRRTFGSKEQELEEVLRSLSGEEE